MSEENQSAFKVTDRRLFNADGSLRDDVEREDAPAASPVITAAPAPAPEPLPEENDAEPERTEFTEFLMRLASEAFIYLGMVEHPMTGRRQVELGAAKEVIDMLVMLRAKTKGNLTRGEDRFYEDLLGDLRMQFVSLNRR